MNIHKVTSVRGIKDAYSRRILGYLIGKDPVDIYVRAPARLARLTRGLTPRELLTAPAKGRWSIAQLVSHLCDAEWAMGFRIRKGLAESTSPLPAYDEKRWAARLHYEDADVGEKLRLFAALRNSHCSLLKRLSPAELRRFGIHAERGKETVERMIHMLAGHDLNHLRQIKEIRSKLLTRRRQAGKNPSRPQS